MLARDHYATLGVAPDASGEEIEEAFLHLSRRYHPDVNPGDPRAAIVYERIEEAYEVLSDPERRARYDREPSPLETVSEAGSELDVEVVGADEDRGGTFAGFFRRLLDRERRSGSTRGDDVEVSVRVPLAQAETGRRATVGVRRRVPCRGCGGDGRVNRGVHRACPHCSGTGREVFAKGVLAVTCPCARCGGDGLLLGDPCEDCRGSGLETSHEKVVVRVPPGVTDGQLVRLEECGHHGPRGGPRGDLLVRCRVDAHPLFERQGPHLTSTVPITVVEAVLGGRVEVPTLQGEPASLRLPPGTSSGETFRLRGRGLALPDGRRGDLLVTVRVVAPDIIDEDSKTLLREFAARNPENPRESRTAPASARAER